MNPHTEIPLRYHFPSPGFYRYWHQGHGRKLARKINSDFQPESTIRTQIPLLFETDASTDQVVREVLMPHGFAQTGTWIKAILNENADESVPELLRNWVREAVRKPAWLDQSLLESGARLCQRSGVRALMVLRNFCLMGGYESAAINKPLVFTGALKKGSAKRISETTLFWISVTASPNGQPAHYREFSCLLTRLIHAHARVSILENSAWCTKDWGEPLNHWDMIATNLGFSLVFLQGIRLLGINPTTDETAGLFHLWKYIGYLIGIPEHLLPSSEEEAIHSLYAWTITQPPADEDTRALAQSLMREPFNCDFPPGKMAKIIAYHTHLTYNSYFLGKASCRAMGLPVRRNLLLPNLIWLTGRIRELVNRSSAALQQRNVRVQRTRQEKVARLYAGPITHNAHR